MSGDLNVRDLKVLAPFDHLMSSGACGLITCVDLSSEGGSRYKLLVEGDVDDVIGALQRHKAYDEPG